MIVLFEKCPLKFNPASMHGTGSGATHLLWVPLSESVEFTFNFPSEF